jgi:hypothetical protein
MIDKELSYEELLAVVTDVVAVLFPRDYGFHTRPSSLSRPYPSLDREGESVAVPCYAYLVCILLSIGRERVWPSTEYVM